jgi:hypothetical protein
MKKALFRPLDLKTWFVVGFTAFLSGLMEFNGSGSYGIKEDRDINWEDILYFPQNIRDWIQDNPQWFALIIAALVAVVLLVVLFTWLSARGKFMFLDNVIYERALVINPWREFRIQGNSLFNWYLVFILIVMVVLILYLVNCYNYLYDLYTDDMDESILLFPAIWMMLGILVLMVAAAFIKLLLSDFIVPVMYKYRINTNDAWRMFLPLLYSHFGYFLGYALLVFFIIILVAIGIIVAGLLTCCIGFLILIIPYINSVVLLPISYTMRAFSVEFLEQFGPEYQIFSRNVNV